MPGVATTLVVVADLDTMRHEARSCERCDLYRRATQTVFGDGDPHSPVVLVGEQPGDQEDRSGRTFVGPAGHLLDRALEAAGIDRQRVYLTNAVKHFRWEPRGKRRIHKRPDAAEVAACRPWLVGEIDAIKPDVVVALGAVAAQSLIGPHFRVTRDHGKFINTSEGYRILATTHPSAVLRAPDEKAREVGFAQLVDDLSNVAAILSR